MTPSEMYADTQRRLCDLFRSLGPAEAGVVVPATPEWTVADVARHLAGVCDDVLAGRIEGAATDPWTAKQVEARKDTPLREVLDEWDDKATDLVPLIDAAGAAAYRLVIDVVTHEQDVRGALHRPGGRDTAAAAWSLQQLVAYVDGMVRHNALPPLRILAGVDEYLLGGEGDPGATLEAAPFELLRGLIGRRSLAQLRSFRWTGDAEAYLPLLPVFPPSETDIVE